MRRPWKKDGWWVFTIIEDGKRRPRRLSKNKAEAYRLWHEIELQDEPEDEPTLVGVVQEYLEWSAINAPPATHEWRLRHIQAFADQHSDLTIKELRPIHLTKYLDELQPTTGTRRAIIVGLKAALNWALDEEIIQRNPLGRYKRPPTGRREELVSADDHRRMLEQSDQAFRLFLQALIMSGARPGEVRTVAAENVDLQTGVWVLPPHRHKTGKKTNRNRIIHLTPCLLTISRLLVTANSSGPIFRNRYGDPWTANAIRLRMKRLRRKLNLPAGTIAYAYRHTFTTNGLANGVEIAAMAELLGHRDTTMISRHYGHLDKKSEYLKQALRKAVQ